jgi:hypothetical protein
MLFHTIIFIFFLGTMSFLLNFKKIVNVLSNDENIKICDYVNSCGFHMNLIIDSPIHYIDMGVR